MKMNILIVALFLMPAILSMGGGWENAGAVEYIDGENETWAGQIDKNSDVVINSTGILTIESGSIIRLAPGVTITVYGELVADGVVFRNRSDSAEWGGIIFKGRGGGTITKCNFFNFTTALDIQSDYVTVENVVFNRTAFTGSTAMVKVDDARPELFRNVILAGDTSSAGENGMELTNTPSSLLLQNVTLRNMNTGLRLTSAGGSIRNCAFEGEFSRVVRLFGSSVLDVYDTTSSRDWSLQNSTYVEGAGVINVHWNAEVITSYEGSPIGGVSVSAVDEEGRYFNGTTDMDGIARLDLHTLKIQEAGITEYNPFNFTASKEGYINGTNNTIWVNETMVVNITLIPEDALDISLSVSEPILDLTDGEVHRYGAEARIIVFIANNGTDNATGKYAVPVFFFSHIEEDGNETKVVASSTLIEVPANSIERAVALFPDLKPGWHNMSVELDPYGVVTPWQNRSGDKKNVASFRVNVPPGIILNITGLDFPLNGTVEINGTAPDYVSDGGDINEMSIWYRIDEGLWFEAQIDEITYDNKTFSIPMHIVNWSFELNTQDVTLFPRDGTYQLWLKADDGSHNTTIGPYPITLQNHQKPQLENVTVMPAEGDVTTTFNITVLYKGYTMESPTINILFTSGPGGYQDNITMQPTEPLVPGLMEEATFYMRFNPPEKGEYTFQIAAWDGIYSNTTEDQNLSVDNSPLQILSFGANRTRVAWGWNATFSAIYRDWDGEEPTIHKLIFNGIDHTMVADGSNFVEGVEYSVELEMTTPGTYEYNFTFSDGDESVTTPSQTINVNHPPVLQDHYLLHDGEYITSSSNITFSVIYQDADGDEPQERILELENPDGAIVQHPMSAALGDMVHGVNYTKTLMLARGNYNYTVIFSDLFNETSLGPFPLQVENTPPIFEFVGVGPLGNAVYSISWVAEDHDDDELEIQLYFDRNDVGFNGTLLQNLGGEQNQTTIDLGGWQAGTFHIYAVVSDGIDVVQMYFPEPLYLNNNPIVHNVSPQSTIQVNRNYTITWNATDPDGDTLEIYLYRETWAGTRFPIASSIENTGSFLWDTTNVPNGEYFVVLEARDGHGDVYRTFLRSEGRVAVIRPSVTLTITVPEAGVAAGSPMIITGDAEITQVYIRNITVYIQGTSIETTVEPENGRYNVTLQAPSAAGTYTILVTLEIDGEVWTTMDNVSVHSPPLPDFYFRFDPIAEPGRVIRGGQVTVEAFVRNRGEQGGQADISLFVDSVTPENEADRTRINLNPGQETKISLTWTATLEGTHTLWILIDPDGVVKESNKDNNNATAQVVVYVLPDFSVSAGDIIPSNSNPAEGRNVSYNIRVRNTGSIGANCFMKVYINTDAANPLFVGTIWIEAGGQTDILTYWPSAVEGRHTLVVVLDPDDLVEETRTDNNRAELILDVSPINEEVSVETGNAMVIGLAILAGGIAAAAVVAMRRR